MAEAKLAAPSSGVDGSHTGPSSLLGVAHLEYWALKQRGEAIDPDAFCARYPSIRSSLARILQAEVGRDRCEYRLVFADLAPADAERLSHLTAA